MTSCLCQSAQSASIGARKGLPSGEEAFLPGERKVSGAPTGRGPGTTGVFGGRSRSSRFCRWNGAERDVAKSSRKLGRTTNLGNIPFPAS